jgi:hypothetical protein
MQTIEIKYRLIPLLPFWRTVRGSVPSGWTEVNAVQLISLISLQKGMSDDIRFLSAFTGIARRLFRKMAEFHIFMIAKTLEWVNEIKPHNEFIIPSIDSADIMLFSPLPMLKKMTFGQFIFADTCFSDYLESQKETDLNRFIAALYLPEKTEFSDDLITLNSQSVANVSIYIREAIVLNYHMIHEWLADVYPMLFIKSEKSEIPEIRNRKSEIRNSSSGWIKIFEQFVGDDIVNQDRYASLPVHNVLRFLSQRIKDNMKKP